MSILDPQNVDFSLSRDEKLKQVSNRVKKIAINAYQTLIKSQKQGINILWENPEFTPQEIIDACGPDIIKIFNYHSSLTNFIVEIANIEGVEPDIKFPTNAFTVSGNHIIVSDAPYVIPS